MRARKVDDNQKDIVDALRRIGCSVAITSGAGNGFPDLVVGRKDISGNPRNWLIEVKDGNKIPSKQRLTPEQEKFHKEWKGQIAVINSPEQAIDLVLKNFHYRLI